jgi:Lrp/AsnC family leucine-responsive transcriptional regulator
MDTIDRRIVEILQRNARTSHAEIARQVELAPSAVLERVRKLESRGVLLDYPARVDPRALGLDLLAFVFVRADERPSDGSTGAGLARIPEALEVHHVAGEDCYLVKVRAASPEALGRLLREKFGAIPTVRSTRTTIVLGTLKESTELPLPALELAEVAR